ncbi:hypothetical protein DFH09DRAFT_976520 [Mycena vulgaris]|nr:hypothetical protein DFH09DRAFT_976520 [Mycena vulgaris]
MTSLSALLTSDAVTVWCQKDLHVGIAGRGTFNATTIPQNDSIFDLAPLPVSVRLECPLVMRRIGTSSSNQSDLDCQIATFLAINPRTGFAPPEWQSHIGSVIVARKDKKPLSMQHLEGFWMYNDAILDEFSNGGIDERVWYTRSNYERWWAEYCKNARETRGRFQRMNGLTAAPGGSDDWSNPGNPYAL